MTGRPAPDLTGVKFGLLTVLSRIPNMGCKSAWHCACACGKRLDVRGDNLRGGYQISCGCTRSTKSRPSHKRQYVVRDKQPPDQSYRRAFSKAAAADLAAALGLARRK